MFASKSRDEESLATGSIPHLATAVLKSALDQEHLDYPEPVIEMLLNHCEDYEDADELLDLWWILLNGTCDETRVSKAFRRHSLLI